ncbi:MAG: RNA polymerase-binding protein DksA [Rhodanobacter sp.]
MTVAKHPTAHAKASAKAKPAPAKAAAKPRAKPAAKPAVKKTAARKSVARPAPAAAKSAHAGKAVVRGGSKPASKPAAATKPAAAKKAPVKPVSVKRPAAPVAKPKPSKAKPAHKQAVSGGATRGKAATKAGAATSTHKTSKPAAPAHASGKQASTHDALAKGNVGGKHKSSAQRAARPPAAAATKSAGNGHHVLPAAPPARHAPAPFKGRVASATAMVTQRSANASAHGGSNKNQNQPTDSMNKTAAKLENGVTREDGHYALPSTSVINLPHGYVPSSKEEYMNPRHLAYFREKLRTWRDQLVEESRQTMDNLRGEVRDVGDEAERATRETENSLELRTRDRYRKLIAKIDKALRRIEEGTYGFCEETDEEIGVERLDARPIATLSLDAQERREHLQKQMGD